MLHGQQRVDLLRVEPQPRQLVLRPDLRRLAREARRKLREKNLDAIAANDVSKKDRGFESDRNALSIHLADGRLRRVARTTKRECAERLMAILEEIAMSKKK